MIKNFFTLSIVLLLLSSSAYPQNIRITTNQQEVKQLFPNSGIVPDVMGRINYIPAQGVSNPSQVDSFPLFNGFPITISGSSYEGGIFCNMDNDPELEFVYCITYTVQAFNMDGSPVAGWPKTLPQPTQSAPAFGDIDGDGQGEIVVTSIFGSSQGSIFAWHTDGTPVTGFPVTHGYSTRTPVLADIDNDGAMEIIINKRIYPLGEEWAYKGDGTALWSQSLNHVPASSAAVGDITGDGVPEIICESYLSLYAMDNTGNILPGFPFNLPSGVTNSYSSPVLADVDGDGSREIIFGSQADNGQGYVHILKNDGTVYPGWPKITGNWVYTPPSVGYIDNDNILDIVVGDQVLSTTPVDYVYAWNANGTALSGFPIGPSNAINSQIILGDINNDGMIDLITDDNGAPYYHGYSADGSTLPGWPIMVTGETTFYEMPALADIDGNGVLDMLGAGKQGFAPDFVIIHLWNTGNTFVPDNYVLPVFQYNERHNGVYGDLSLTIPVELVSFTASVSGSKVVLNWNTATETNNRGFEIQRQRGESNLQGSGSDWQKIAFVDGNGTTTNKSVYSYTDNNAVSGKYYYRLKQIDFDGSFTYSAVVNADLNNLSFSLSRNYPNPFNPSTEIRYSVPERSLVTMEIYNALGQKIMTLVNGTKEAGSYTVTFNADNLPSGVYMYRLSTGKFSETKKMILEK